MNRVMIIICVLFLVGCSAFRVHDSDKSNTKGIPFYIKKGIVKQVTTYTRSWIEATLNYHKLVGGKRVTGTERSATISISEPTYNQIKLGEIFAQADAAATDGFGEAIDTFYNQIKQSCESKMNCEISPQIITKEASSTEITPSLLHQALEANTSSYVAIVDYQHPYYLNATVPPFGTTTATTKLAPDGTLTEVSSTVDSTKLAELIPLKELLIDKLGIAGDAKAVPAEKDYSLTLSISVNGYKYNLNRYHPYDAGLNLPPLRFDSDGVSVSRTKFGSGPKKTEDKKKKGISIEGSIVLPEDR